MTHTHRATPKSFVSCHLPPRPDRQAHQAPVFSWLASQSSRFKHSLRTEEESSCWHLRQVSGKCQDSLTGLQLLQNFHPALPGSALKRPLRSLPDYWDHRRGPWPPVGGPWEKIPVSHTLHQTVEGAQVLPANINCLSQIRFLATPLANKGFMICLRT